VKVLFPVEVIEKYQTIKLTCDFCKEVIIVDEVILVKGGLYGEEKHMCIPCLKKKLLEVD
jgi:formylmethanofuran dehydrogenase subunit E